jgi:hypothetical protein
MIRSVAILFMAVQVGAGFGAASAELISTSSNAMEVELRVEVRQSAESVIAHLAFADTESLTIPLVQRESGVFGIRTEVKKVNYAVVFELIGAETVQSEQHSLADLGLVFPESEPIATTTTEEPGLSEQTQRWGWLALGFGAAALSVLAFWVLGGREPDQESPVTDSTESFDPDES